jgi:excisionase family DNA binding protein
MNRDPVETELLRVEEAAEVLAISRRTVFELLRCHELPVVRIGRAVRIPKRALGEWIARQTDDADNPHRPGRAA